MNPRERERRFRRIQEIGCVACHQYGWYSAPDVHHLNLDQHAGQKRRGDEFTIGLCPYHHRGVSVIPLGQAYRTLGPSLAREPNKFREVFGDDDTLLDMQNRLIAAKDALSVLHSAARSPSHPPGAVPTTAGDVAADLPEERVS